MDEVDLVRLARLDNDLAAFTEIPGHNMTPVSEVQRRVEARLNAIRVYFTEEGEGIGTKISESLKFYFTTDPPRKPNAAARRARQATATLLVKAANRIAPHTTPGPITAPAWRTVEPAVTSSPGSRTWSPAGTGARTRTRSPASSASSTRTTASAPAGITAPVAMATACPGPTALPVGRPAIWLLVVRNAFLVAASVALVLSVRRSRVRA